VDLDVAEKETPAPVQREDSAKRRQIMDGARKVFLAEGFDAASMGEIARKAGVSKGTLYVYFDSKERLFEATTSHRDATMVLNRNHDRSGH
jgi:AcrR family transcriptional regulator